MVNHAKRIVRLVVIARNILFICYLSSYVEGLPQRMATPTSTRRVLLNHQLRDFFRSNSNQQEEYQYLKLKTSVKTSNECPFSSRDSDEGINSETYCRFVFNYKFYSSIASFPPGSDEQRDEVHEIYEKISDDESLTMHERGIWLQVSTHLLFAYDDESGVIFYNFKERQWQLCTQVSIYMLFHHDKYSVKLCVGLPITLLGIELPAITRDPIDSMDYLSDELINKKKTEFGINTTALSTASRQAGPTPSPIDSFDPIYVDLFTSSIYTSNCAESLEDDSCHTLCCNSLYIGSEFCEGTPLRCS